jgi:hypothetical protein
MVNISPQLSPNFQDEVWKKKWSEVDLFLPYAPKFQFVSENYKSGRARSKIQQVKLFLDMLWPSNIT